LFLHRHRELEYARFELAFIAAAAPTALDDYPCHLPAPKFLLPSGFLVKSISRSHPDRLVAVVPVELAHIEKMKQTPERRQNLRRSTRVPIRIRIEVEATGFSCEGETIVVNLHGALVKTSSALQLGTRTSVHVQLTGKSAAARVVFASRERPLEFGIGLDEPQNIWGVSLAPADWRGDAQS